MEELSLLKLFVLQSQRLDQRNVPDKGRLAYESGYEGIIDRDLRCLHFIRTQNLTKLNTTISSICRGLIM